MIHHGFCCCIVWGKSVVVTRRRHRNSWSWAGPGPIAPRDQIGGRGFPDRRILSLGTMGMGAWPDSRVVRPSDSADFPQKGKNGFWWWNIPRKDIRNYPWRESSLFFAAHLFDFRQKNGFRTEEHFWFKMGCFWSKKWFVLKKFYARGVEIQKKSLFQGKKKPLRARPY